MERKYLVCDERETEIFCEVYDDPTEAANAAQSEWEHFTRGEQKSRHVYTIVVTRDDLNDDAIDEDGEIYWTNFHSCNDYPGCFDSDRANEFKLMQTIRLLASHAPENADKIICEALSEVMNFIKSQNLNIENYNHDFEDAEQFAFRAFDFYRTHGKFPRAAIEKDGFRVISNTDLARAVAHELELLGHDVDYRSILDDIDIDRDNVEEAIPVLPEIIKSYVNGFVDSKGGCKNV